MGAALKLELSEKTSKEYAELLDKLKDMPTLPVIAMRVGEMINDPNATSGQIAAVLKQDQVLTAKILRLVNSSYYAVPGGVTDVQKALAFLGFNTVSQLVLSLSVFSMFTKFGDEEISMKDFWMHSICVGVCAENIAKRVKGVKPEEAFTCGLLHDIGKLVLHRIDPEKLKKILTLSRESKTGFVDIERQNDWLTHAYIGEMMAQRWGLPQVVRFAIRYHHSDVQNSETLLENEKKIIQIIRLANRVVVKSGHGKSGDYSQKPVAPSLLAALELTNEDLEQVNAYMEQAAEKAGVFLNAGT